MLNFCLTTKKRSANLYNTNIYSTFVLSNEKIKNMKEKTMKVEVTESEFELLESIRNYNRSYPDGYPELLWYAQQVFDSMLRKPY